MEKISRLLLLIHLITSVYMLQGRYPIAVLHGTFDQCNSQKSIDLVSLIKKTLNTYVKCIEIGEGYYTSINQDLTTQSEEACTKINQDPNFYGEFGIIGISQGSMLARYVIQKCLTKGTVKLYMSLGGAQMGIYELQQCKSKQNDPFCLLVNFSLKYNTMLPFVQQIVSTGSRWRDIYNPFNPQSVSYYLTDLNNEFQIKNHTYKERILALERLILVEFIQEDVIYPPNSVLFGYIKKIAENIESLSMQQTPLYIEDYIGLKQLDSRGSIQILQLPGKHCQWSQQDILYILQYLV